MTNVYAHSPAPESRWGYIGIFLVWSLQVNPPEKLLVDWACSGLGSGHMTPRHMISHRAGPGRDLLFIDYSWYNTYKNV